MPRRNWSREELIVAFNLYCRTPFGRIHIRNPDIIALGTAIGRTPSAVSWKLANFARLDPVLGKRNIKGARHGSRAESDVWKEFDGNWDGLVFESERILADLTGAETPSMEDLRDFPEGKVRNALVRVRVNQSFFRTAILAAYGGKCCITGLSIPQLLNASHIVPWAVDTRNRTNPRNGLCLNALHDKAFDCGLLTVTPELRVRLSPLLSTHASISGNRNFFEPYNGVKISRPSHFTPASEFLRYHNEKVFLSL